jgi:hypothetical protein
MMGLSQMNKRPRFTPSPPMGADPLLGTSAGMGKPALLSASQKKANHIQSEQKRRANIRKGYEALCETVPSLREAIKAEEEAQAALLAEKGSRSRRRKPKNIEESDKQDGRAGPKSENVVLVKSEYRNITFSFQISSNESLFPSAIDYITSLQSERTELLSRLDNARATLSTQNPDHPALTPASPEPLWEREWKGGEAAAEDDDDEEDS